MCRRAMAGRAQLCSPGKRRPDPVGGQESQQNTRVDPQKGLQHHTSEGERSPKWRSNLPGSTGQPSSYAAVVSSKYVTPQMRARSGTGGNSMGNAGSREHRAKEDPNSGHDNESLQTDTDQEDQSMDEAESSGETVGSMSEVKSAMANDEDTWRREEGRNGKFTR
ncbi:hypothetical protein R1sor_001766 [Riccia sorocarpa]|uniref:Uncharacterized protein n=1 Tax=Riccia sorocarpa TaxID=122646 RepID=A0ABD3GZJ9_9MARC